MKNIQVIDGAENCAYDIFAATDEDFLVIFPLGQDIAFIEEVFARVDPVRLDQILTALWTRRIQRRDAMGIHGLLFYQLERKAKFYPTRCDADIFR